MSTSRVRTAIPPHRSTGIPGRNLALVEDAHRRILCVDDEPNALTAMQRALRSRFDVVTANSSRAAMQLLDQQAFAVVVSDLRLPGMDGNDVLSYAREVCPDTVRILISGQADLESALKAINEGQLFRFLIKPCGVSEMLNAVTQAAEFHRSITAERVLLEQTLTASVGALVDLLAITQPESFGRASRLKQYTDAVAKELKLPHHWALGVAAQLSQVGYIIVPEATASRARRGLPLTDGERALLSRLLPFAEQLVGSIPRLDPVRAILRLQYDSATNVGADDDCIRSANVLRAVMAFDALETAGVSPLIAIDHLERTELHDPMTLNALRRLCGGPSHRLQVSAAAAPAEVEPARDHNRPPAQIEVIEDSTIADEPEEEPFAIMMLSQVRVGMRFADDVFNATGVLLVARGQQVTASLVERILNSWSSFANTLAVRVTRSVDGEGKASGFQRIV